ncbi:methyl-accepting chemotaxis protein [Pseudohoeflea coraliihabitans]|uniref:HAMP domain-containing protein n=1 Tax=Pseudohoeflea coraliihabitans TaxID=2860393 RepID=A0ABS6WPN5_9HYPH|nr:methyl-accepting chemotaxis protein [Pseudohoeflea sp. DP4N28-3]MBW3097332.1 HAMP domain-containing protein [Pseudohoeflea sp. DP4N28-3]
MLIDRLLSRFSIQTKVLVFVVPLLSGIIGLAVINLYTGSLLGQRLDGTGASIQSLSGFQRAYSGMNEFLGTTTPQKRDEVIDQLEQQVVKLEAVLALAETEAERQALEKARMVANDLRDRVDELWQLHGEELSIRAEISETLAKVVDARGRVTERAESSLAEIAAQEAEAKGMLRRAEEIGAGARTIAAVSTSFNGVSSPEEIFVIGREMLAEISAAGRMLDRSLPENQPGLRNMVLDNIDSIVALLKDGGETQSSLDKLQRYANGMRPAGLRLQGLSAQAAIEAAARFGEIDPLITRGRGLVEKAQRFARHVGDLQLQVTEYLGRPSRARSEALAMSVRKIIDDRKAFELDDSGTELLTVIGEEVFEEALSLSATATALLNKNLARRMEFASAAAEIGDAWQSVISFADSQRTGAVETRSRANGITLGSAIAAALGAVFAALLLIAALKGPILRLVATMRTVARGELDVEIIDAARRDEIGEMARALDVFKTNAVDKIRIEQESEDARRLTAAEKARADAEKARAEEALQQAVGALGEALRNLADGNLVARIETPFEGNLDQLRVDFNESVERVRDALSHIRDNALSIQSNGGQMRAAADDLARRTEQQAASLEEVAAAVEQISTTVRTTSEGAAETDKLALATRDDAVASEEVVKRAVAAMERIETASSKIAQIITVIDGIAFQTNLLALNAGVEAARAGDAGRGFAVVAQEVRELAGRSANAAREIKSLIADSSSEVTHGVSLVNETGAAMSRINERIGEITVHITRLAQAGREQSVGLAEVNTSVGQMDQMTQQNAAMVEQTSAASHQLAAESDALMALVQQFRIEAASETAPDTGGRHDQAA